jgi:hypothetical protein
VGRAATLRRQQHRQRAAHERRVAHRRQVQRGCGYFGGSRND